MNVLSFSEYHKKNVYLRTAELKFKKMREKETPKGTLLDSVNPFRKTSNSRKKEVKYNTKYFTFFNHAPIALWIEDFSRVKEFADNLAKENNTNIKTYIVNNPNIILRLASLVKIKEVNKRALKMYKASSQEELLGSLDKIFTKKSSEGFANLVVNILLGDKETEVETVNKRLDGEEFDVLIKFEVVDGFEETLENVIVSVEDITERIKNRRMLAESERRYKESQEIAKIGSWYYCFETEMLKASDETYRMIGVEPHSIELNLEYYLKFVHNEDKKRFEDFSFKSMLKKPNQSLVYRIYTKDGELKYINEKRNVIINDGRVIRIVGIGQDITERILAENKLNVTKNLLSNTLESIEDGFVILDHNSNYTFVNKEAAELLNKRIEDLLGENIWFGLPEKEGDLFFDNYQRALKTKKPISFENYFPKWDKWYENRIIPSDYGFLMFFHEITDKKITENKIKAAYNIINKSSSVALLCKNESSHSVEFASENTINLFGYKYTDFVSGKVKIHDLIHPEDSDYFKEEITKISKGKGNKRVKLRPFRCVLNKGVVKWIEADFDAVKNEEGEITHIQGIFEDISERKKTEDLFFESNQRLKDQFNNTPLASIMFDNDMKVTEWNDAAQKIFGYSAKEAKGKYVKELIITPDRLYEIDEIWKSLLSQKGGYRNTNKNITKNGDLIICDWYNVSLKDANGNVIGVASLANDITDVINSKILLEKSERKYRDIFEKSVDSVLILNDGVFVDCNASTLKVFGYETKKEVLKVHPSKLSPEKQPDGVSSFIKAEEMIKVAFERGSNRFTWYHQKKNGQIFPAEVTLTRIDEDDKVSTIHSVVRDISERVRKETLEDVLYNISKAALTISKFKEFCFFIKDELNKIIDTKNFFIAIYNEDTNMCSTPFYSDEMDDFDEFSAENTLTGYVIKSKMPLLADSQRFQNLVENGDVELVGANSKVWVGVPLKIKEKVLGVIVVQSYVNEYAYNYKDVNLLEFVADQISTTIQRKKAYNELKNALTKAQESDRLKSAFLANMSHEIRTPMNGIIGFSELFVQPNLTDVDRSKYANIVINSSKQLLSIVNDILDISKIEAGVVKLNYESVNINKLLDGLLSFFQPRADKHKLKLVCEKGLENFKSVIETDRTKLNQVLTNLLSNAFKFTDHGSVEFGYEMVEKNLRFFVKDTGVGIEKELQNRIFDRFIQANMDLDKTIKGTGLGLSISKKFIELFGGDIWISSNNEGTTIFFTVPYVKSQNNLISTVSLENNKMSQIPDREIVVLVAEDEEYNMMYINELFSKSNFKIIEANNGKQAVEMVLEFAEIDLVLMDIKMPIMNGNEAMKEIRKTHQDLPIIALSAFAMESDKVKAINNGFSAYVTKPIDKSLLFSVINKFLS